MDQIFKNSVEFVITLLLIGLMISVSRSEFTAIPQVTAQNTSAGNMTAPMLESARFHLKSADELITRGDTIGST